MMIMVQVSEEKEERNVLFWCFDWLLDIYVTEETVTCRKNITQQSLVRYHILSPAKLIHKEPHKMHSWKYGN